MSARTSLNTSTPYTGSTAGGPRDFAGDRRSSGKIRRSTARPAGLALRVAHVAAVLLAASTSLAQVTRAPEIVAAPVKAHLSGTLFEKTLASDFGQPEQIAIDSNGNLYIADILNNDVYKETPVNGVYVQSVLRANLCGPEGVAVDSKGDVFIANSDCGQILEEELLSDGSYVEKPIPTNGLGGIICELAANSTGTALYIADCFNNRVVAETLSSGEWSQSVLPLTNLSFPQGLALTADGNELFVTNTDSNNVVEWDFATRKQTTVVSSGLSGPVQVFALGTNKFELYIADTLNDRIALATYNSTTQAYQTETFSTGKLDSPTGVAVDLTGDVFIADTNNKRLAEDTVGLNTYFGSWPVGEKSTTATLTFTFDNGGKIGAPAIGTTNNKTSLFFNKGTGSCVKGATFATGKTCTIEVYFDGQLPGYYYGTADLNDFSGNVLAPADISATGVGSLPIYPSTVANAGTIGTDLKSPAGVAIDLSGNTYISDPGNKQVVKVSAATTGHPITQSVVVNGPNYAHVSWIAVDSVGDVFINEGASVVEESPASGDTYTETVVYGRSVSSTDTAIPGPIVVGRFDNLWISFPGELQEYSLVSGAWTAGTKIDVTYLAPNSTVPEPITPISLAVDGLGNFYVGEPATPAAHLSEAQIVRYTPQAGFYPEMVVESGIDPQAIAVDPIGNVWVADNTGKLYSFSPTPAGFVVNKGGNSTATIPIFYTKNTMSQRTTLNKVSQLAEDGLAQILMANTGGGDVLDATWTDRAQVLFPTLQVQTSLTEGEAIYNLGNGGMNFTVPSTGQNPSLSSGPFTLGTDEGGACPILTSSSEPAALAAGEQCVVNVTFAPTTPGNFTSSLTYKYTDANGAAASLSFVAVGSAIQPIPTINWPAPAAISYGTPLSATQLNATASYNGQPVAGTFTYLPPLGTVLNGGSDPLQLTFNPSDSAQFSQAVVTNKIQVNPVPLIVVADSFSQTYGSPIPTFTASYLGFVNGDTPSSLHGAPVLSTEATQQFPWGYYPITITQGTLSSPNYTFSEFVDGTLVITQAPLTLTATNQTVTNSSDIPNPYPCTISGFVNGDTAAVVSGACATNAQSYSSSPAGSYTVTPATGTLSALNYYFTNFTPGTLTISQSQAVTIGSGFHVPEGVAVDASGNVYVTDAEEYYVVKETLASGTFTQSDVGLTPPSQFGIAVDASGNLYVTSSGTNEVWEWTYANGAYTSSVIANSDAGINIPWGIAVDKNGNVFVSNSGSSSVIELKPAGGGEFSVSTIANSSDQGLNGPEGIAVDSNGNVYICDSGNERVVIMNYSGGKYTLSSTVFGPFDQLTGVAVDLNGNVYISAATQSTIYKETLSNGAYTQSQFLDFGILAPGGVAVDANGNVYVADTGDRRVVEIPVAASASSAQAARGSTADPSSMRKATPARVLAILR